MPTTDFTPTAEELAVFMKNRTKTRYGAVVGAFTDDTPVTLAEVGDLISNAVDEIAIAVGADLPSGPEGEEDLYKRGAKQAALILASMNVELTLAGEQVSDPRSPYAALERRLRGVAGKGGLLPSLIESVTEVRGGYGGGGESAASDDDAPALTPAGSFPAAAGFNRRRW